MEAVRVVAGADRERGARGLHTLPSAGDEDAVPRRLRVWRRIALGAPDAVVEHVGALEGVEHEDARGDAEELVGRPDTGDGVPGDAHRVAGGDRDPGAPGRRP